MKKVAEDGEIYAPFCVFALTVPAANAAVGQNWLPAVIAGLAACLFCGWVGNREKELPAGIRFCRIASIVLLAVIFLNDTHLSWPGRGAEYVVPLILLVLAGYAVWLGRAARGANVLRFGVYGILGVMFLSGLSSLRVEQLLPKAEYPTAGLVAVLLLPLLGKRIGERNRIALLFVVLAAALVTAGIREAGLYRFSRGLSVGGAAGRIESLTACAMTAGYYALLVFLLDAAVEEAQKMPGGEKRWFLPILTGLIYAAYLAAPQDLSKLAVAGELILWGILPLIWPQKRNPQKREKRC